MTIYFNYFSFTAQLVSATNEKSKLIFFYVHERTNEKRAATTTQEIQIFYDENHFFDGRTQKVGR